MPEAPGQQCLLLLPAAAACASMDLGHQSRGETSSIGDRRCSETICSQLLTQKPLPCQKH